MLAHTKGIVLRQTRYGDSSLILQVYTREYGSIGCVVSGVRSARSRHKAALYQPMSLLELVLYFKEDRDLQRIKEARFARVYGRVPFEPGRRAVGLFMAEVLLRALREEPPHPELYDFAEQAFHNLDGCTRGFSAMPHAFLLGISDRMGFAPQGLPSEDTPWFDLQDGVFCRNRPTHGALLRPEEGAWLVEAGQFDWTAPQPLRMDATQRQILLDRLLRYMAFHVHGFGVLRSPEVFRELGG